LGNNLVNILKNWVALRFSFYIIKIGLQCNAFRRICPNI
jgi:hypothetical protein